MELPEGVNSEQYNLKWNRYHSSIASNIFEHLSQEELVDVTLSCQGKFIKAHKLILSASSQYFKELFQQHKNQNPIIIMTNIRFEYLEYIINYIYKGEIKLLSSEIQGLLSLANELKIKGLCGILNKSFQHLTDMREDIQNKEVNNKLNTIPDKCCQKTSATILRSSNIPVDCIDQIKFKHNGTNDVKKREGESSIKQERNSKRKKTQAAQGNTTPTNDEPLSPLIVLNVKESFGSITEDSNTNIAAPESQTRELFTIKSEQKSDTSNNPKVDNTPNNPITKKQTSAFMLFTDEYRSIISREYPDESVKEISLRLSSLWKHLPIQKKDSYYEEASRRNEELRQKIKLHLSL